jgi:hypothetical protein
VATDEETSEKREEGASSHGFVLLATEQQPYEYECTGRTVLERERGATPRTFRSLTSFIRLSDIK